MEDFDVFTNEINYSKQFYSSILNKFVNDVPSTPSGPNYQSEFTTVLFISMYFFISVLFVSKTTTNNN